jgi:hypothetical protein
MKSAVDRASIPQKGSSMKQIAFLVFFLAPFGAMGLGEEGVR